MVDPELYIKQGLKIIETLVSEGNFQVALNACQELLKVNPYNRKVQKTLRKIEERIVEKNEEKVNADIEATKHLWKEERYEDLLKIYTRLYQYAPQNRKLQKLLQKVNEKLSAHYKDERSEFIKKALAAISELIKNKQYADTIQASYELLRIDPLNAEAQRYLKQAKEELIDQKLKENERIIESADFERSLEFIMSLLSIDPENAKLKKLALQTRSHLASQKLLAERIHLNESVVRMKELFKNAEYEKVLQACEEIERLDPGNFTARIFRKKAKATLLREIEEAMVVKLREVWKKMEEEYIKKPVEFVKI